MSRAHRDPRVPCTLAIRSVVVLAILSTTIIGWRLFVDPHQDRVDHVDAVLVLGPALPERIARAQALVSSGLADRMLVSVGRPGWDFDEEDVPSCADPEVTCFVPRIATTAGEAEVAEDAAERLGWSRIAVVTSTVHLSRATMIFDECTSLDIRAVAAPSPLTWWNWAYEIAYQSAAFVKFGLAGCD